MKNKYDKVYIAIDLKSFYASVECQERGLNPITTNLVVADSSRTEKTVCLAVSPSLKQYGIPGRARLFEVIQKVKEINVEIIKSALKRMGSSTKAQIAEETGISVATCGKILNELCDSREVIETAQTSAGYGRPAKCYAYNGNFALVACIYIASDMGKVLLSAKVSNMLGEVQEEYTLEIGRASFDVLETTVGRLVEKHDTLRAVAIGIPGYITDGVVGLCNFIDLMGLPLRDMLQEKFPQLKIQVENDMNAAAYGFYKGNCNEKETTVAFIYSPIDARTGLEEMRTGIAEVE